MTSSLNFHPANDINTNSFYIHHSVAKLIQAMTQKLPNWICQFTQESLKSDGIGKHFNDTTLTKAYEATAMLAVCFTLQQFCTNLFPNYVESTVVLLLHKPIHKEACLREQAFSSLSWLSFLKQEVLQHMSELLTEALLVTS